MRSNIQLIGAAWGLAANNAGCADGPEQIQSSLDFNNLLTHDKRYHWHSTIAFDQATSLEISPESKYKFIVTLADQLSETIQTIISKHQFFITLGGDHSCAIGTWSGACAAYQQQGPLGLVWIDAHMDANTPDTSLSGNIHGMPVASLLGYGDKRLINIATPTPKIDPKNMALIGIRSYESGEAELLKKLGVRIYFIEEVIERGIQTVLNEAIGIAKNKTAAYGISIDLDGFDPTDAPAVGIPEPNGIVAKSFIQALQQYTDDKQFIGTEIAEYNPHLDQAHKTEKLIVELLKMF